MAKNCHGKQTASLFSFSSLHYKYMLLLLKSDFYIQQSLIFKQKLLLTVHKQSIIWQTCRTVERAAGREKQVSHAMEQIPPTSLKMAQDPNATLHMATVLLFELVWKVMLRCLEQELGNVLHPPPAHYDRPSSQAGSLGLPLIYKKFLLVLCLKSSF